VLEKEAEVAVHQTGHNSGVIHAGIYYQPGSAMARCCVNGARKMYEYCMEHDLPYSRCGKMICASNEAEAPVLEKLLATGTANGVEGLEIIDGAEVARREPNVKVHSALWSPNTGIADFSAVTRHVADELDQQDNCDVHLQFEVDGMANVDGVVEILGREPGQKGPTKRVIARNVITAGGLQSDTVAKLGGGAPDPAILTFRGTYYQMKPEFNDICATNIYPVPGGGGIPVGVHFTPTVNQRRGSQMIVGPGACLAFDTEAYSFSNVGLKHLWKLATHIGLWRFCFANLDLAFTEMYRDLNKKAFMDQARKLVPSVTDDMVEESFAGVMAQIFNHDGSPAADFIFERNMNQGTTLNVRNAPTPACTASFAIAEEVVDLAAEDFGWGQGVPPVADGSVFYASPDDGRAAGTG